MPPHAFEDQAHQIARRVEDTGLRRVLAMDEGEGPGERPYQQFVERVLARKAAERRLPKPSLEEPEFRHRRPDVVDQGQEAGHAALADGLEQHGETEEAQVARERGRGRFRRPGPRGESLESLGGERPVFLLAVFPGDLLEQGFHLGAGRAGEGADEGCRAAHFLPQLHAEDALGKFRPKSLDELAHQLGLIREIGLRGRGEALGAVTQFGLRLHPVLDERAQTERTREASERVTGPVQQPRKVAGCHAGGQRGRAGQKALV